MKRSVCQLACWSCGTTNKLVQDGDLHLCRPCQAEIDFVITHGKDVQVLNDAAAYAQEVEG